MSKKINGSTQNHIDLLKEYYAYDEDSKVFTIPLCYEKVEDILDMNVLDCKNHPRFKKEVLEEACELLMGLPTGTKADLCLRIKDYQGYDPDVLLESFNKAISLNQYRSRLEQKRSGITATILALVGAFILFLYIYGKHNGWFGNDVEGMGYEFVTEILDIVGWVFIWEAVSVIFLYGNDYRSINAGLFIKINQIGFYDETGKNLLSKEELKDQAKMMARSKRWEAVGRNLVLVGSAAMLMYGAFSIYTWVHALIYQPVTRDEQVAFIAICIIGIVLGLLCLLLGAGGLCLYMDKPYLRRFTTVMVYVLGIYLIFYIISITVSGDLSSASSIAFPMIVYVLFAFGYFLAKHFGDDNKKGN